MHGVGGRKYTSNPQLYLEGGSERLLVSQGTRGTALVWGSPGLLSVIDYHSHQLLHAVDWFPSLVELAGGNKGGGLPLDGISQLQTLLHNATTLRAEVYYGVTDNSPCVHTISDATVADRDDTSYATCVYGPALRNAGYKIIAGGGGGFPDTCKPLPEALQDQGQALAAQTVAECSGAVFNDSGCTLTAYNEAPCGDSSECCTRCTAESETKCTAWTFHPARANGGSCYLSNETSVLVRGVANATCGCPKAGVCTHSPAPPPATCTCNNTKVLMFAIVEDPEESQDVSAQPALQPTLVSMEARLREYKATGVPQRGDDPACGKAVLGHDPHVGAVWQPWC